MSKYGVVIVLSWVLFLVPSGLLAETLNDDAEADIAFAIDDPNAPLYQSLDEGGPNDANFVSSTAIGANLQWWKMSGFKFGDLYSNAKNDLVFTDTTRVWFVKAYATGKYDIDLSETISYRDSVDVAIGDIDQDGDMDVAYTDGYWIEWSRNLGSGFAGPGDVNNTDLLISKPKQLGEADVDLGDLNGDGYPDLVVALAVPGYVYWAKNTNGVFLDSITYVDDVNGVRAGGVCAALGDLDNDGDLDVIYGNAAKGFFCLNDGDANFTNINTQFSNADIIDIASSDFNGDGYADVVYTTGGSVYYNLNTGLSPFFDDANAVTLSAADSNSVAVAENVVRCAEINADLNNDCYVDFKDFSIFSQNWLKCTDLFDPNCN